MLPIPSLTVGKVVELPAKADLLSKIKELKDSLSTLRTDPRLCFLQKRRGNNSSNSERVTNLEAKIEAIQRTELDKMDHKSISIRNRECDLGKLRWLLDLFERQCLVPVSIVYIMVNPSRLCIGALAKGRILFPLLQQRLDNPATHDVKVASLELNHRLDNYPGWPGMPPEHENAFENGILSLKEDAGPR